MRTMIWTMLLFLATGGLAQAHGDTLECSEAQELDKHKMLRRMSLDLRLTAPSYEEHLALETEESVPDSLVDEWLMSDAFRMAMRRLHADLLWPNPAEAQLADVNIRVGKDDREIYSVIGQGRRKTFRKGVGNEICGDWEQTEFVADGAPLPLPITDSESGEFSHFEDGWVWVTPYWDPAEEPVRVCAFDAQSILLGKNGVECGTRQGRSDRSCGCGPSLRHCYGPDVEPAIREAMREQLLRLVDSVTVGGRPYSEMLTTLEVDQNGVLDFWKKHLAQMAGLNKTYNDWSLGDADLIETPAFFDETWRGTVRSGPHAGVVTLPAYTLRFQTNRGRANRFRIAFTSQYFVPSANPIDTGCDPNTDDLTQKCVCRYCHQALEPMAAHFADFAEAGSALINDTTVFPLSSPECIGKNVGACARFYVSQPDAYNSGTLLAYQFADIDDPVHNQISANIEGGPGALAQTIIGTGQFARATVRNVFRHLMGRDMNLDPSDPDNEIALLTELGEDMRADDDFPALVKRLVGLPQYRRIR